MRGLMTFQIPDELIEPFVQWIRDFDTQHADCKFNIFSETKYNAVQMRRIFDGIQPGFPFVGEWKLKDEK